MGLRVLFATAELFPIAKVGGLGDVAHGLGTALAMRGADLRIALPAYRGTAERLSGVRRVAETAAQGETFTVLEGRLAGQGPTVSLFDCPALFDRDGDMYADASGATWPDEVRRFVLFSEAVARYAADHLEPDVVHAHDWHTGLTMPWLRELGASARRVFTIHNLSHAGRFSEAEVRAFGLPASWWHMEGIEFHGDGSCLKAGIAYADIVTTVSPTYAAEIVTPERGFGMDGLLRSRAGRLHGVCNGIDERTWNPATDSHIAMTYDATRIGEGKAANKAALQHELGLREAPHALLTGMVTRLYEQKGADLVLEALDELLARPVQLAMLCAGDRRLEAAFLERAAQAPDRLAVRLGHDEPLAHRLFAGADVFLMPSRFEPCGLTQMYAQRYGTVPVAHRTGGLADTVTDATPEALEAHTATGVLFHRADAAAVVNAVQRALELRAQPERWRSVQLAGMHRDFSWRAAATRYEELYRPVADAPTSTSGR